MTQSFIASGLTETACNQLQRGDSRVSYRDGVLPSSEESSFGIVFDGVARVWQLGFRGTTMFCSSLLDTVINSAYTTEFLDGPESTLRRAAVGNKG